MTPNQQRLDKLEDSISAPMVATIGFIAGAIAGALTMAYFFEMWC